MGGTESKPDQSSRQQQQNHNDIIDQSTGAAWLQLNWASFGGGSLQSSSLGSSSCCSTSAGGRTDVPTPRPGGLNCTSSSPLPVAAVASMGLTNIGTPHLPRGLPPIQAYHPPVSVAASQGPHLPRFTVTRGPSTTTLSRQLQDPCHFMEECPQAFPQLVTTVGRSQFCLGSRSLVNQSGRHVSVKLPGPLPAHALDTRQLPPRLTPRTLSNWTPGPPLPSSVPHGPTGAPLVRGSPDRPLSVQSMKEKFPELREPVSTPLSTNLRPKKMPVTNFSGSVHSMKFNF